jgi:hypothetical protein
MGMSNVIKKNIVFSFLLSSIIYIAPSGWFTRHAFFLRAFLPARPARRASRCFLAGWRAAPAVIHSSGQAELEQLG